MVRLKDLINNLTVMDVATGQYKVKRTAFIVNNRMDFRGAAPSTDAYRLILLPPFAPLAAR